MARPNVFEDAVARIERIGKHANVGLEVIDALRYPKAILKASLPVRLDNGSTEYFIGYRCRYNDALGPTKGGIRFHPTVTPEEIQALALWMTIKCAVIGIPYGDRALEAGLLRADARPKEPLKLAPNLAKETLSVELKFVCGKKRNNRKAHLEFCRGALPWLVKLLLYLAKKFLRFFWKTVLLLLKRLNRLFDLPAARQAPISRPDVRIFLRLSGHRRSAQPNSR